MAIKKKKKKSSVLVVTGIGRFSHPHLAEPDSGRSMSDDKYKVEFFQPKATFKENNKDLLTAILAAGRKLLEDDSATLGDFKHPLHDTDKPKPKGGAWDEKLKGSILLRAKSDYEPAIVNADLEQMSHDEVRGIKGGDIGRLVLEVKSYSTGDNEGVTVYLKGVQFARSGKALGEGKAALLKMFSDIEIDLADVDPNTFDENESDDSEEVEQPKSKAKGKAAKKVASADDEEDSEDEEADGLDLESDEEDEEAEPEVEAPKAKKGKAAPVKVVKKATKADEELDFEL